MIYHFDPNLRGINLSIVPLFRRHFVQSITMIWPAILVGFASLSTQAATISVLRDSFDEPFIEIKGTVEKGDLEKVQRAAAQLILAQGETATLRKLLVFHINTPGGDAVEAMKIGTFFREVLASAQSYGRLIYAIGSRQEAELSSQKNDPDYVFMPRDAEIGAPNLVRNYSAGVLMFYGAVKRAHRDNSDQRNYPNRVAIPVIGIHRPYFSKEYFSNLTPQQADDSYQRLEAGVRSYLARMGAPQALADRMFASASSDVELIPQDDFRKLYKPQESFIEEWIIARCGVQEASSALAQPELSNFRRIEGFQIASRLREKDSLEKPPNYIFPNPEFSTDYIENLYRLVKDHNLKVQGCRVSSIGEHQLAWARSFVKAPLKDKPTQSR